ncbi:hypothetical protein KFE25_010704 [Diacronema lutheri]|uniref:Uncharacterized protein n=1 Tax=Diacronema lutheri TaxID=2081491 RepID=A0A8J5X792_DIALT|nr:hypothetical protein KFE25_010704 [Diacronema lutheri]
MGVSLADACRNVLYVTFSNRNVALQVMQKDTRFIFLSAQTLERCFAENMRVRSDKRAARAAALVLAERAAQAGVTAVAPAKKHRYHGKYKEIVDALKQSGIRVLEPISGAPRQ